MFRRALTRLASSLPSASLAAGAFASLRSAAWCTEAEDKQEFRLLINAAQLDHRAFDDFERIGKATVIELLSSQNSPSFARSRQTSMPFAIWQPSFLLIPPLLVRLLHGRVLLPQGMQLPI